MRMPLSLAIASPVIALLAGASAAQAAPFAGLDSLALTASSSHVIAYRTVCDRFGERCRRVYVDDGYRASGRGAYGYDRRPGTYLGSIYSPPSERYYGSARRGSPPVPGNDAGR